MTSSNWLTRYCTPYCLCKLSRLRSEMIRPSIFGTRTARKPSPPSVALLLFIWRFDFFERKTARRFPPSFVALVFLIKQ